MERFLCLRMCVCVLQDFKMTQYFGHFKSEFDAVKAKLVYCKINKIK